MSPYRKSIRSGILGFHEALNLISADEKPEQGRGIMLCASLESARRSFCHPLNTAAVTKIPLLLHEIQANVSALQMPRLAEMVPQP